MENSKKHLIQLDMEKEIAHGIDVSNLAYCVADELNLPKEECYELAVAGMLHDIGKLEVAKYVYSQEDDTLTIEEMKYVRSHSQLGYEILKEQGYSPYILDCILHHHENYDGTGYPFNLEEDEIPLSARILRVCDVFAALTSERPYRTSFGGEAAIELMIEEVKNFDMKVFLAFMRVINDEKRREFLLRGRNMLTTTLESQYEEEEKS